MKVGYQTIIWGPQIEDLEGVLDVIAAAGYDGVEFAQRPEMLRRKGDTTKLSIRDLLHLLEERQLCLLSFAAGMLDERVRFCADVRPHYLYIEDWDPEAAPAALARGFTLGLHPHVFKRIHRLSDALDLLKKHPDLKFILDTAHLKIAGDDPVAAVRAVGKERLLAVHLKDWTPEFGRSSHRYARGFTELGRGIVELQRVLDELDGIGFDGWLVVEQDATRERAQFSTLECAKWLGERHTLRKRPKKLDRLVERSQGPFPDQKKCDAEHHITFVRSLTGVSGERVERCYDRIAAAFRKLLPSHFVVLWACSPANDLMSVLAVSPEVVLPRYRCQYSRALSSIAVERQCVTRFDLDKPSPYPGRDFQLEELKGLGLKQMVAIPVFNPSNHNHMRLLVNLFPRHEQLPVTDNEMLWFGMDMGRRVDILIDEICSMTAARANLLAGQSKRRKDLLRKLRDLIREVLSCEGVSIFLVDEGGEKLELAETTGATWHVGEREEQFYHRGEGLTGRVWERNEPLLTADVSALPGRIGKCIEDVGKERVSYLSSPLVDSSGQVVGVVRCRNKRGPRLPAFYMFSEDDVAIVDAISQAALPHLQVRMAEERHRSAVGRVTHELKTPIMAIRGATQLMQKELERAGGRDKVVFTFDYLDDIMSWSELARRWIGNADFFRYSEARIPLRRQKTLLMADVVAPAVRQVKPLLEDRRFRSGRIRYEGFETIPALSIDRNLFQQVMFNLLSNGIKYAYEDPNAFEVEIQGQEQEDGAGFAVYFRDWGMGVEEGMEDSIFDDGFRTPKAMEKDVTGQGFGLWVVRQVLEAHGATIEVTNNHLPTEFTIDLPKKLEWRPPARRH